MKCKFCKGEGRILIISYTNRNFKHKIQDSLEAIDCPHCRGTGLKNYLKALNLGSGFNEP